MPNWLPWRERLHSPWHSSFLASMSLMVTVLVVFVVEQGWSLSWERQVVLRTLQPGLWGVRAIEDGVSWAQREWQTQYLLAQHALELERKIEHLSVDISDLHRLRSENEELRRQLQATSFRRVSAEWWGVPRAWWMSAGCQAGVRVGNPVVVDGVFVGEVTQTLPSVSAVRAVDDLDWQFPVRVGTQSAVGVFATARGVYEVREVSQKVSVQVDDVVTTTGTMTQPANLPVARITKVEPETGFGTWRIEVEPLKAPSEVRWAEVMIDPHSETGKEAACLMP